MTKLTILINVLKDNFHDYYKKQIDCDFLSYFNENDPFDNIAYLMEHVRKLKVNDTIYSSYLQHCYAIYEELKSLVILELKERQKNYIDLISGKFTHQSKDLSLLLQLGINDSSKIDELYNIVNNDNQQLFTSIILNLIVSFKNFEVEKNSKISKFNQYTKAFYTTLILLKSGHTVDIKEFQIEN